MLEEFSWRDWSVNKDSKGLVRGVVGMIGGVGYA